MKAAEGPSFAQKVRDELIGVIGASKARKIQELLSVWSFLGEIRAEDGAAEVRTENGALSRKVFTLLKKAFNISVDISTLQGTQRGKTVYGIRVREPAQVRRLADSFSVAEKQTDPESAGAYLRGAFLAAGTLSDPERYYRLEFLCRTGEQAGQLLERLRLFGLTPKTAKRGALTVVYLQEAEQVSEALGRMEASLAVLELENIRIFREMRGSITRKVNCETSNLQKTVTASAKQVRDIAFLREQGALAGLPDGLREAASLREARPDASLAELGTLFRPPIGRSGVNHRLRALCAMADALRKELMKKQEGGANDQKTGPDPL